MQAFKLALCFLTRMKWGESSQDNEGFSRSLAHFPVVGLLMAAVCVLLDLSLTGFIPVMGINAIILIFLMVLRTSRELDRTLGDSKIAQWILFLPKFILLIGIPPMLRWIAISLMCADSSMVLSLTMKLVKPEIYSWENVLWAFGSVLFLSILCGPLGLFTWGMVLGTASILFKFFRNKGFWYEEAIEVSLLGSMVVYIHLVSKIL